MLGSLVSNLFSTVDFGPQFLIELFVLICLLEFIRIVFDFTRGGSR